jgi:hypothetical protein
MAPNSPNSPLVDASRGFLYDDLVGRLAQRLERSVYTRKVEGSNPSVPTIVTLHPLQDTKQSNLSLNWKLSDFVEEDRASTCQLKPTQALLSRARKGALLMAEQLRSAKITGDCRPVHTNERARSTI